MSTLEDHDNFIFYDENDNVIQHKNLEREEQLDAYIFLPADSTVLEFGARYGTVSSLINRVLKDPTKHVAVEPDTRVISALTKNRDNSGCKYKIFNGAVSRKNLNFVDIAYGSSTIKTEDVGNTNIITLEELQTKYSLKFDVIVADCEGCICSFVEENDISQFKLILLEKDQPCLCDYEKLESILNKMGFICIRNVWNIVYRSVYINMNFLPFRILSHSVNHGNIGIFGKLGYISENITDVIIDNSKFNTFSLHAPSILTIETQKEMLIRGYASPTAKYCPILTFQCDNSQVGVINTSGSKTNSYRLLPGKHELIINTTTPAWAHSIWLFEEI
jgi:FkbM family methyltransferase